MLEVHAAGEQLAFKVRGAEASTYLGGPGPSSSCFMSFPKLATTNSPFFLVSDGVAIGSSNRWPDARKTPLRQIGCERDQKSALGTRKITWRASSAFSAFNVDRKKIVFYGVASTTKEVFLMRREKKLPHKCRFGPIGNFWRHRIVN